MAHEDTPILLKENGKLVGLPDQYGNAHFDTSTFSLTIGNKKILIPDCIKDHFKHYSDYTISFASSWYHDTAMLPPYIHLDIVTKEEPYGYKIFFDLSTLKIYEIWNPIVTIDNKTNIYDFNEIEIPKECQIKISEAIITTHNK